MEFSKANKNILVMFFLVFGLQNTSQAEQQCDPNIAETTPSSRFEINRTDGTVFDTKTKLTWKICSEGQVYSDEHCNGVAKYKFRQIEPYADNWRLPNQDELNSIVEKRCKNPSVNLSIFPETSKLVNYWTDTKIRQNDDNETPIKVVDFANGETKEDTLETFNFTRLVRGEKWIDANNAKARQTELAERTKNAPNILKAMSKDNFCVAYGNAVREEVIDEIGDLTSDVTLKLVKTEAKHRKLVFNISDINNKTFVIGITKCQLYSIMGQPDKQISTVGSWGEDIQNVYESEYIYTRNGRVTSWQQTE